MKIRFTYMYGDNHQLYKIGKQLQFVHNQLVKEAELVSSWYKENPLQTNMEKYQILTITPKRQGQRANDDIVSIKVDGNEVISSKTLKILGVDLDEEMNFSRHISELCKRSSQKVGVILRLRNLIPVKAKLELYKSSVHPQLIYCHTVWHFCKASDRRKLERVQERALRAIFHTKTDSYEELLNRANLSTL